MSCLGLIAAGLLSLNSGPDTTKVAAPGNIYLSEQEISAIEQGTACRNLVKQFFALQKRMSEKSVETDFYDLQILKTDELVAGRKGKYYAVYLKDAKKRKRFSFPGGQYVIKGFKTRFRRSLTAFVREILAVIEGGAEYDIFVRGSGSSTPMATKRSLVETAQFDRIAYIPKVSRDKYDPENVRIHTVFQQYSNPESPSLKLASKINASQCSALLIVG